MKKYFLLLGLVVCLGAHTKLAQQSCRAFETARHNINNVEIVVTNYGIFGQHENGLAQGCWWPIGTNRGYIFGAGIWFGTIDSITGDTLVTVGYNPAGGQHEFAPGRSGWSVDDPDAIIFMYPETWPLSSPSRLADVFPAKTLSHQDSWCVYNDSNPQYHMPGDTRPIGIEVYQTVYAWDYPGIDGALFLAFEIKNVSGQKLQDCYVGVCTDCDIGEQSFNDKAGGVVDRTYILGGDTLVVDDLGYQWQEDPEPGWEPPFSGVIGFDLLQTPFDLEEGADKDGDGIPDQYERDSVYYWNNIPQNQWDVDSDGVPDWRDASENPQLEMTAFAQFTLDLEPYYDRERFPLLAGCWGSWWPNPPPPYDTMPGDPDDYRFLMSSGPFNLEPDSSIIILIDIIFADWRTPDGGYIFIRPDSALVGVDKWCQFIYDMNWLQPSPPPSPHLACIPGDATVTLIWDDYPETESDLYYYIVSRPGSLQDTFYREYDFEGYGIWKSLDGQRWDLLQRYDLYNDIVFDDPETGIYATNTGLLHHYLDNDVRNGFTYYYTVTSFDYNYIGRTTPPRPIWLESHKVEVPVVPRREPANYQPGTYSITTLKGNPTLADSNVGVFITYPLQMTGEPLYLDFGPIVYDEGYPWYSASLFDADETRIDSVEITLPEADQTFHDFGTHHGLSITAIFQREDIPTNTSIFDRVEVSGYPDTLVAPGIMPTNWAYRGNDYAVRWKKKEPSGLVNTVVVVDKMYGDTIFFKPYMENAGTDSLAQCWCFRSLTQSTDTLVYGDIPTGTRYLYICGGRVLLKPGQYLAPGDPRPSENALWTVYANRDYLPAPANARIQITPTPATIVPDEPFTLNVKVVPNPYIITNEWQQSFVQRRMRFINLPGECTIRIFNLNGELVKAIQHYHTSGDGVLGDVGGDEWWDLLNEDHELVASGVYIFHIDSDVGQQIGKFVIIR